MKIKAPVRFLGEERAAFTNDDKQEVKFMKVVLQSVESVTDVFTFNLVDETACNLFANLQPMSEGYAVLEMKVNGKFIQTKLKGWEAKKTTVSNRG